MFFFTGGLACGKEKEHWGDLRDFFSNAAFFKEFCLADLDEWSEVREIRDPRTRCCVLTQSSATYSWDKDSCLGRSRWNDREKEVKKEGERHSLDASISAALAWPLLSATCEDGRGNPTGSRMSTGWSGSSRALVWVGEAKTERL